MRTSHAAALAIAAAGALGVGVLIGTQGQVSTPASGPAVEYPPGALPDPRLTPGDTLPVTAQDVCQPGYAGRVRNVPESVKAQVYAEYGIKTHAPGEYEVDHLISLELGGSNSLRNLWPESYRTQPWNARVKDALEDRMHAEVCAGRMTLQDAQASIRSDWIAAYRRMFRTDQPLAPHAASRAPERP